MNLESILSCINQFLSSGVSLSFFAPLAGAFAGAVGAQQIIKTNNNKEGVIKEIRNVNTAIAISSYLHDALLQFDNKHFSNLHKRYEDDCSKVKKQYHTNKMNNLTNKNLYQAELSLGTFSFPLLSVEPLKKAVFEEVYSGPHKRDSQLR